jgi:hypothetical protein
VIYRFKFARKYVFHTRLIVGHRHDHDTDKMVLYFPDGGVEEIPEWCKYRLKLGPDWVAALKKSMEAQAGQAIPLNV